MIRRLAGPLGVAAVTVVGVGITAAIIWFATHFDSVSGWHNQAAYVFVNILVFAILIAVWSLSITIVVKARRPDDA